MNHIKRYRGRNAEALLRRIQEENLTGATLLGSRTVHETEGDPTSAEVLELIVRCDDQQRRIGSLRRKWRNDKSVATQIEQILRAHEIPSQVRDPLLQQMSQDEGVLEATSVELVRETLSRILTGSIPVTTLRPKPENPARNKQVIALIGPPGAGKTTIAAKLAAIDPVRTAFVSTGEVSNRNSLNILDYARAENLAYRKVETSPGLSRALKGFENFDVVIVDTASICRGERGWTLSMGDEAQSLHRWAFRYHVVLGLKTQFKNNLAVADTYLDHPVSSFVFTHLDLSGIYGDLIEVPFLRRIPISALSRGSEPGDELIPASPEVLAELLTSTIS